MNKHKEQVEKILLMPIECTTQSSENIFIHNERIFTSQKYKGCPDPDMSDIAIGFYNIIYEAILPNGNLLENDDYCNVNFLGDTMNSFNSIANIVPGAGRTVTQRTNKETWPSFLRNYHNSYHCLANFWVLPRNLGRCGKKLNSKDSVDIFLNILRENYSVLDRYSDYSEKINKFEMFCEKHFISKTYTSLPNSEIKSLYNCKETIDELLINHAEKLIAQAQNCWILRADCISSDNNICEKLYQYFDKLGILSEETSQLDN